MNVKISNSNQPVWKVVNVKSHIPEALKKLDELAHNLWWSWNTEALDLFESLDKDLWRKVRRNPIDLLRSMDYDRLKVLSKDEALLARMNKVYGDFRKYMDVKPDPKRASVAYFCMEYGLSHVLKIYSGGLGILAGDYLKEASDSNVDMIAVGFLYRYGYFTQSLSMDGQQIANYEPQDFENIPIERVLDEHGNQLIVDVPYPNFMVHAALWVANVGRIKLYLLDTDNELHSEYDRRITHSLYGGDWENRIKQEYLLGIGGMLALKKMGITKEIYHCNEGHAALCNVQRLVDYVESGLNFNQALELVRASSLYTVHTPVPAGHDYFDEGLFNKYMNQFPTRLGISWDDFMGLGRTNPEDKGEKFCMSTFLCKTCQEVNGVSWLHGRVSQQMFKGIWPGYMPAPERLDHAERTHDEWAEIYNPHPEESHVGYVTNGVHFPTWCAKEWQAVYAKYLGKDYIKDQSNEAVWENIYSVPDEVIWNTRVQLKNKLIDYIRARFRENWLRNQGDPSLVVSLLDKINPNALLIGFARRFATYKRAHLLFTDLDRLAKIVNNEKFPVQFVFSGKAHPADGAGQGLIKRITEISRMPQFEGKIIFLEDYNMIVAKRLVTGVDIWLNTPTRPLEASGTSGEKAEMNGVLNFSVLDGWWYEGYRFDEKAGWALTEKRTFTDQSQQDKLDAATIYSMLENEIIPLYYAKNSMGYSPEWIQYIKRSIGHIAPHFTMKRELDDYIRKFYAPEAKRAAKLMAKDYAEAREIVAWKEEVASKWDQIQVVSCSLGDANGNTRTGSEFKAECVIDAKGLGKSIGVELVVFREHDGVSKFDCAKELKLVKIEDGLSHYELDDKFTDSGVFHFAFRMFPKSDLLAHRQDFAYVRWF